MGRDEVMAWVAAYERTWRDNDLDGLAEVFTPDARYLHSPYEEPLVGLDAIRADWPDPTPFTLDVEPVAVDGEVAVVRALVRYTDEAAQEYRDLWLLTFAEDGRVRVFEEWAYWPGKPWTAEQES
ncbi:MAG TPA: nuclear transport factor 2 family protein [Actinotalea sp.]|nr:nuclear transport factor 2 family protein [Actinotalea sp.]